MNEGEGRVVPPPGIKIKVNGGGGVVPPPGIKIKVNREGGVIPPPGIEIEVKEGLSLLLASKLRRTEKEEGSSPLLLLKSR